jgi:hypothetical protein
MDIAVSRSIFQREVLAVCFGLSQRGLLHFGHTVGRSLLRGSHSWPQRHRQPSSLTMPMSFVSLATVPHLLYLLILDTTGIDKGPRWDILSVYTIQGWPRHATGTGCTATARTRDCCHCKYQEARQWHLDRSFAIRRPQSAVCRDHYRRREILHLSRFRVAPTTLQTRVRCAVRSVP